MRAIWCRRRCAFSILPRLFRSDPTTSSSCRSRPRRTAPGADPGRPAETARWRGRQQGARRVTKGLRSRKRASSRCLGRSDRSCRAASPRESAAGRRAGPRRQARGGRSRGSRFPVPQQRRTGTGLAFLVRFFRRIELVDVNSFDHPKLRSGPFWFFNTWLLDSPNGPSTNFFSTNCCAAGYPKNRLVRRLNSRS